MPMPRTEFVASLEEVQAFGRSAAFPCVIKPNHFREWQRLPAEHPLSLQKVAVVNDASQLCEAYKAACAVTPEVIVQEVIQGDDSVKSVYFLAMTARVAASRMRCFASFDAIPCDSVLRASPSHSSIRR